MRSFLSSAVLLAAVLFNRVADLAPTDEYRDADPQQSGYLPNHNMDPAIVNGPTFGQLWKAKFNQGEQVSVVLLFITYSCWAWRMCHG
jgi:hypothetical protein